MNLAALPLCANIVVSLLIATVASGASPPNFDQLRTQYDDQIQEIVKSVCLDCHSTESKEGEFDLQRFAFFADVRRDPAAWQRVAEMLDNGEMPPQDSRQPSDAQRQQLREWVQSYLNSEALAGAGDPGPVVLRRLSNSEYNYTAGDLTGVDSLNPTAEFPVDGAAGEGFTNSGSAQGMSPSLVQKYLDAAKAIAEHAVLVPDGIRFSRHVTRRDHSDEWLARIQSFYRRFTEDGGGVAVDLQGIKFDTNQGGLLPIERYLKATLSQRDALASGRKSIDDVARQHNLNAKYLTALWESLTSDAEEGRSVLMNRLRQRWQQANVADAAVLAAEITRAQQSLWRFNSIGHIGREGGPASWMEAMTPITTRQELRLKLPKSLPEEDVVIYLTASDLGDGNEQDYVVWERPRIEFGEGGPIGPILLRDVRAFTQQIKKTIATEVPRTTEYLEAVRQFAPGERDRSLVQSIIDRATVAQRRYLPDASRTATGRALTEAAIGAMGTTEDPDLRLVWARASATLASDAEHVAYLLELVDGTWAVPGFEPDQQLRWALTIKAMAFDLDDAIARVELERERDPSDRGQRAAIRARVSRPDATVKQDAWARINGEGYGSDYLTRAAIAGFQWSTQRDLTRPYRDAFFANIEDVYATRDHAYAESYLRWLVPDLWAEHSELERIRAFTDGLADEQDLLRRHLVEVADDIGRDIRVREFAGAEPAGSTS
jgi:hypothetical protein